MRTVRVLNRVSQYELERRGGIRAATISLIEREYREARESQKMRLAQALGVSVAELFPEDGNGAA